MSSSKRSRFIGMGLVGLLPMGLSCLMSTVSRDAPALERTERSRTLQFSRYLWDHGLHPVSQASKLDSVFTFRNTGDTPITIGDIERSCGCMTPELRKSELAPGETGLLRVPVEMAKQEPGPKEFQLTVHYADPEPKQETLLIKAVFPQPQIEVRPSTLIVTQRTSKPFPAQFRIQDYRSEPLTVMSVESTSAFVTPSIREAERDGHRTPIALEIDGSIPAGIHRVLIAAATDDSVNRRIVFPMMIKGPLRKVPVDVKPSTMRMYARETEPQSVTVTLPSDWEISHVDCFPEQLEVTWNEPQKNGNQQQLELSLRLTEFAGDVSEGVVTLQANDGEEMVSFRVEIVGE